MKYIVFSFDDGRADTYTVAMPIMQKYGLTATVNIISDYVLHPDKYSFTTSSKAMTAEQVLKWQEWGEIASHGSTHKNTAEDIIRSLDELRSIGVHGNIGFASPESWLTDRNADSSGIYELKRNGIISYLRSGIQIRREGVVYTALSIAELYTHSSLLYYFLNRQNIIHSGQEYRIFPSCAVKDYSTVRQLKKMVKKVADKDALIIMFHSVLEKGDPLYGKDHYFWDATRFDQFCQWLCNQTDVRVITTMELCRIIETQNRERG